MVHNLLYHLVSHLTQKQKVLINCTYKNLTGAYILEWTGEHWNTLVWNINKNSIDSNAEIKFTCDGVMMTK